jgi:hypothetical protein
MMDLGKLKIKEFTMNERISYVIGACLVLITAVFCLTFYTYNQTLAIKSNIESAIVKGIDPISVRCAYGSAADNICIAYAARK